MVKRSHRNKILLYNRKTQRIEEEIVFKRRFMDFFYGSVTGRHLTHGFLSRHIISNLYGWLQKTPFSRRKIEPFISQYSINRKEILPPEDGFKSFTDFFIRKLKPGTRPVSDDMDALVAPAQHRILMGSACSSGWLPLTIIVSVLLIEESRGLYIPSTGG